MDCGFRAGKWAERERFQHPILLSHFPFTQTLSISKLVFLFFKDVMRKVDTAMYCILIGSMIRQIPFGLPETDESVVTCSSTAENWVALAVAYSAERA